MTTNGKPSDLQQKLLILLDATHAYVQNDPALRAKAKLVEDLLKFIEELMKRAREDHVFLNEILTVTEPMPLRSEYFIGWGG